MYSPYSESGATAPNYKQWDDWGKITPNVEISEGLRPTGDFMPAPYLPMLRYNEYFREYFVVSAGKILSFDTNGNLIPSGYRKQAAAYKAAADAGANIGAGITAADALTTITKYTATDVAQGVKNAKGVLVVAGEPVVKSFFTITALPLVQTTFVSTPVGSASYNFWRHPGGDGVNPAFYRQSNWNLQHKVGFLTRYVLEVPLVANKATYDAAPFTGIAACVAASGSVKAGMYITYDADSNYAVTGYDFGAADHADILGQVTEVFSDGPFGLLDKVRTAQNGPSELDKMPGTATGGKSDMITYAGAYGSVRFLLSK